MNRSKFPGRATVNNKHPRTQVSFKDLKEQKSTLDFTAARAKLLELLPALREKYGDGGTPQEFRGFLTTDKTAPALANKSSVIKEIVSGLLLENNENGDNDSSTLTRPRRTARRMNPSAKLRQNADESTEFTLTLTPTKTTTKVPTTAMNNKLGSQNQNGTVAQGDSLLISGVIPNNGPVAVIPNTFFKGKDKHIAALTVLVNGDVKHDFGKVEYERGLVQCGVCQCIIDSPAGSVPSYRKNGAFLCTKCIDFYNKIIKIAKKAQELKCLAKQGKCEILPTSEYCEACFARNCLLMLTLTDDIYFKLWRSVPPIAKNWVPATPPNVKRFSNRGKVVYANQSDGTVLHVSPFKPLRSSYAKNSNPTDGDDSNEGKPQTKRGVKRLLPNDQNASAKVGKARVKQARRTELEPSLPRALFGDVLAEKPAVAELTVAKTKTSPSVDQTNGSEEEKLIKVIAPMEDDKIEEFGYPVVTTSDTEEPPKPLCFSCGSGGINQLIFCSCCSEPFHPYCTEDDLLLSMFLTEFIQDKDSEEKEKLHANCNCNSHNHLPNCPSIFQRFRKWKCHRCIQCKACKRKASELSEKENKFVQCSNCLDTYDFPCAKKLSGAIGKPDKEKWLCQHCLKCTSCGLKLTKTMQNHCRKMVDENGEREMLCLECFRRRQKGSFCPVCLSCYDDNDWDSKMMECEKCARWIHAKCEDLNDEKYYLLSSLPESIQFVCRLCLPVEPDVGWRQAVKAEFYDSCDKVLDLFHKKTVGMSRKRRALSFNEDETIKIEEQAEENYFSPNVELLEESESKNPKDNDSTSTVSSDTGYSSISNEEALEELQIKQEKIEEEVEEENDEEKLFKKYQIKKCFVEMEDLDVDNRHRHQSSSTTRSSSRNSISRSVSRTPETHAEREKSQAKESPPKEDLTLQDLNGETESSSTRFTRSSLRNATRQEAELTPLDLGNRERHQSSSTTISSSRNSRMSRSVSRTRVALSERDKTLMKEDLALQDLNASQTEQTESSTSTRSTRYRARNVTRPEAELTLTSLDMDNRERHQSSSTTRSSSSNSRMSRSVSLPRTPETLPESEKTPTQEDLTLRDLNGSHTVQTEISTRSTRSSLRNVTRQEAELTLTPLDMDNREGHQSSSTRCTRSTIRTSRNVIQQQPTPETLPSLKYPPREEREFPLTSLDLVDSNPNNRHRHQIPTRSRSVSPHLQTQTPETLPLLIREKTPEKKPFLNPPSLPLTLTPVKIFTPTRILNSFTEAVRKTSSMWKSVMDFRLVCLKLIPSYFHELSGELGNENKFQFQEYFQYFEDSLKKVFVWFDLEKFMEIQAKNEEALMEFGDDFKKSDVGFWKPLEKEEDEEIITSETDSTEVESSSIVFQDLYWNPMEFLDRRKCLFCDEEGDLPLNSSGRLLYAGVDEWVHVNCALWSSEVWEEETGALQQVDAALQRGKKTACAHCDGLGATLNCCAGTCRNCYHFLCSLEASCSLMQDKTCFCPQHVQAARGQLQSEMHVTRKVYVGFNTARKRDLKLLSKNLRVYIGSMKVQSLGHIFPISSVSTKSSSGGKLLVPVNYSVKRIFLSKDSVYATEFQTVMRKPEELKDCRVSSDFSVVIPTTNRKRQRKDSSYLKKQMEKFINWTKNSDRFYDEFEIEWGLPYSTDWDDTDMNEKQMNYRTTIDWNCDTTLLNPTDSSVLLTDTKENNDHDHQSAYKVQVQGYDSDFWPNHIVSLPISTTGSVKNPYRKSVDELGFLHPAVGFLIEQLPGVGTVVGKHKFGFCKPSVAPEELAVKISKSGCARFEGFGTRKPHDMFAWLKSNHRTVPNSSVAMSEETVKSKGLPIAMRFRNLKERASKDLVVLPSYIHGRGLFARRDIEVGEMLIEYAGEVIRSSLCDLRERKYENAGIGCYMFRINSSFVIDATMKGNAARFINHSCDPNCESKIVKILGKDHILILALKNIGRGEELVYDYKFERESDKLPCSCGSKKCRRFLN